MNPRIAERFGERDDLFRLLIDRVIDYAIFVLDPSGIIVSWNAGAQRIKGYFAHEIMGHHFSRFYPEEAIRAGWPQTELEHATRDGRFEDEGWRIRKDGSRFWANVVITALYDDNGVLKGFAKVTRDLTDRKRIERLEADAQVMGEFVAMLAHELRNPLAPIRNAVFVGRHASTDPARVGWALDVIDRQSRHMTKLVDDLLDVSRITRGLIRLKRRRMRLGAALDLAVESVRGASEAKHQHLVVERTGDPIVRGDGTRLAQILTNLLSNACKYTHDGGRIVARLDVTDSNAVVRIEDNGLGIPADLLPRIFDLFTQDKRSLDRSEGGLGLGLAIATKLAQMHGGTLRAESAGRGCGSAFTLSLPLHHASGASTPDAITVLIVEDHRDGALALQALLELHGFHCVVAFDGESGLAVARETVPDVVLLDVGLPGMDGYQVVRAIRAMPELEGVTIAAITGYSSEADARLAIEAGFDVHLAKPVTIEDLARALPILESGLRRDPSGRGAAST